MIISKIDIKIKVDKRSKFNFIYFVLQNVNQVFILVTKEEFIIIHLGWVCSWICIIVHWTSLNEFAATLVPLEIDCKVIETENKVFWIKKKGVFTLDDVKAFELILNHAENERTSIKVGQIIWLRLLYQLFLSEGPKDLVSLCPDKYQNRTLVMNVFLEICP